MKISKAHQPNRILVQMIPSPQRKSDPPRIQVSTPSGMKLWDKILCLSLWPPKAQHLLDKSRTSNSRPSHLELPRAKARLRLRNTPHRTRHSRQSCSRTPTLNQNHKHAICHRRRQERTQGHWTLQTHLQYPYRPLQHNSRQPQGRMPIVSYTMYWIRTTDFKRRPILHDAAPQHLHRRILLQSSRQRSVCRRNKASLQLQNDFRIQHSTPVHSPPHQQRHSYGARSSVPLQSAELPAQEPRGPLA